MPVPAESSISIAPSTERLWTARIVHTALEEGLAKMDMAIATCGRREPLSLFCYGEPGTGKTTLAELFIDRHPRRAAWPRSVRAAAVSRIALHDPRGVAGQARRSVPFTRHGRQPHAPLPG